jgi:hypothetical protein
VKRYIFGLIIFSVVAFSTPAQAVDPIEDSRIDLIRSVCISSQGAMQRVLVSDRVTRINRGRAYEDTLKLLAAFNSRASLNTYNVSDLVANTSSLETQFGKFKTQYLDYEQKLKVVIAVDCKEQPAEFYNNLQRARASREALQVTISDIDKTLVEYRTNLDSAAALFPVSKETE